ncbi:MAG TPA: cupin domain-containing protein [Candidatus Enterococcus avicola]|uniref:Cupin domain-containing protein n=1 Tax=Candidatus Enterococcus avicola TaxID=2838561 RepID=A0A9D2F9W2_9ENTE|nr:cupin domain-containing protein [Candidatus Enterococcus avicola]
MELKDYGKEPIAFNMEEVTLQNENYRTTLWTGEHFQLTLMSIPAGGGDIGMEVHPHVDQFLRLEAGTGRVEMGPAEDQITFSQIVKADDAIIIPANTWHNVTNVGNEPMKLYSIYSPANHPFDTEEETKQDAIDQEG